MMDSLKNLLLAGLGAVSYSQDKLRATVSDLIERGELTKEQGEQVVSEWMDRGKEEQESLSGRFQDEVQKVIEKLGLVHKDEVAALAARVEELEKKLEA